MKRLVLAFLFVSTPILPEDSITFFMDKVLLEDKEQYDRLDEVLRSIVALNEEDQEIVFTYLALKYCPKVTADELDDTLILEEFGGCKACQSEDSC